MFEEFKEFDLRGNVVDMAVGIIVVFAVFLLVKGMNNLKRRSEEKPAEPPKPKEEVALLTEIRDALKNR